MNTDIADASDADLPVSWYVHKHRREHEAAYWDERRLCPLDESTATPLIAPRLLIKFITAVIGLAAALGAVVTLVR
jgi:hypothetical protein